MESNNLDNQNKFLGKKKIRLENIISNQKKLIDEEESDEELQNYKKLTSGKLNIKNILSHKNTEKEIENNSIYDKKINEKNKINLPNQKKTINNNSSTIASKLLTMLPCPKKDLRDKISFKPDESFLFNFNKYKDLANPDREGGEDETQNNNQYVTNISTGQDRRVIDVNVDDQVDKNWSLKYIKNFQNDSNLDSQSTLIGQNSNKHKTQLSNMINDYKLSKESSNLEVSKYSKVTTREKYGW